MNGVASWFLGPSTDAMDTCNGYIPYIGGIGKKDTTFPKHGMTMLGMHCFHYDNYREYAQVKLLDSLQANQCYYVEFFTKPDTYSPYLINNIAANFSSSSYASSNHTTALNVPMHITRAGNPIITDTTRWSQINGIYIAAGGEQYITLGNFNTCQSTNSVFIHPGSGFGQMAYYFIDSVSVIKMTVNSPLPWSYQNHTILLGDSVYIGNHVGGSANIQWYTMSGNLIGSGPGVSLQPDTTRSYEVRVSLCGITYRDTVKVTVKYPITTGAFSAYQVDYEEALSIFPSPALQTLFVEWSNRATMERPDYAQIFDFAGTAHPIQRLQWSNKKAEVDIEGFEPGVYFLNIKNNRGQNATKKFSVGN